VKPSSGFHPVTWERVRASFQIPPRMQGSWNDDDVEMLKVMVESSRGVDGKPSLNIKGSLQYHHKRGH